MTYDDRTTFIRVEVNPDVPEDTPDVPEETPSADQAPTETVINGPVTFNDSDLSNTNLKVVVLTRDAVEYMNENNLTIQTDEAGTSV